MPQTERLYALDGLRGLCAISIMLFHFFFWNGTDWFQIGYFGVYLFFVLSGFSMWYVYANQPLNTPLLRHFFIARLARILPLYLAVSLLSILARWIDQSSPHVFDTELLSRFLLNITLLFGFADPGRTSIVPGGWSIGIEWVFYMVFPVFLIFARRLSTLLLLTAAFGIINQIYVSSLVVTTNLIEGCVEYTQFVVFLVYFSAGMVMAEAYHISASRRKKIPVIITQNTSRLVPLGCLAFIFLYPSTTAEAYLSDGHFGMLVVASMLAIGTGSLLSKPTAVEVTVYKFLGNISYSVYLLHFFVYHLVQKLLAHFYPDYGFVCLITIASIVTLISAYLSYRLFESPARNWIIKRLG